MNLSDIEVLEVKVQTRDTDGTGITASAVYRLDEQGPGFIDRLISVLENQKRPSVWAGVRG